MPIDCCIFLVNESGQLVHDVAFGTFPFCKFLFDELGKMTLERMLEVYCLKFSTSDTLSPTKALVYYEDIDWKGEPVELIGGLKFDWKRVVRRLDAMTARPDVPCKTFLFVCKSRDDEEFER